MFNVKHAIIGAEGDIRIGTFKMTKAKSDGFDTHQQLDRFLRTKLKHKGLHTRWKRYGSWTFTDDSNNASHLYVWSTTKGTAQHKYTYQLDDGPPLEAYDDMMLMRFPADTSPITLKNHLDITQDHVKEWLECVLHRDEKEASSTNEKTPSANKTSSSTNKKPASKNKSKPSKPKAKTQKHTDPTNETLDEANNEGDSDEDDDDVLDVDEAVTAEDENMLEDALDDTENNKELLLDEDEDDEEEDDDAGSDDEGNRVSDDEDDDFESAFDTDMLQYEEYTYNEPNKLVKKPLLLSLWTN